LVSTNTQTKEVDTAGIWWSSMASGYKQLTLHNKSVVLNKWPNYIKTFALSGKPLVCGLPANISRPRR